ncbi:HepT-like ribonuclease domain-containing protein [uncultured Flavobacterium sp.]|uniref:HepT-like ribonuclease domain-containing protein n=1 Tax=uncultured Flavobacterium sp. TaxID=165435 RepID=UPI0034532146
MVQAIGEINSFLPEKRNFLEFQHDLKTRRAIERDVEIIGEAVNRILKLDFKINC